MAEVSGVELYLRYERPVLIRLGILKQPIRISPQNIIMIITPLCAARHFIVHEKRVTAIPAAPANSFHHFLKTVINESLTLESVYRGVFSFSGCNRLVMEGISVWIYGSCSV